MLWRCCAGVFHALVGVVVFDAVAARAQVLADQRRQRRAGRGAVPVAHYEVGMLQPRKLGGKAPGHSGHGVAVEVDAVAMARVGGIDGLCHGGVVRAPAAVDARAHLGHGELALVDGLALVGELPDQPLAQAHLAEHLGVGGNGVGPVAVEQAGVQLGGVAVGVQVDAGEMGLDPGHAERGGKGVDLLDVRVFGPAQRGQVEGGAKVVGVLGAAVGRVEHQRGAAGHRSDGGGGGLSGKPRGAGDAGLGLLEAAVDQFQSCMHRQSVRKEGRPA